MGEYPDRERLKEMAGAALPRWGLSEGFRVVTDTTDFFRVDYGDVVVLGERPYLVGHNAKEGRFGLDEEVKHWVKRAVDLTDGSRKVIKLVFHERFTARVGGIAFECFRSPRKEARILELVRGRANFMQGFSVADENGNLVRVLDFIKGDTLYKHLRALDLGHEEYFHGPMPEVLDGFLECARGVRFLHEHGEKHGDIRGDHIIIDASDGRFRWIDFDYNYRHVENIYGYDLFGLGNVLAYVVGKGDVLARSLAGEGGPELTSGDLNIVFKNRVVNLKKVYPYIPESLNRVLMHFSSEAKRFYEHTREFLEDLGNARSELG